MKRDLNKNQGDFAELWNLAYPLILVNAGTTIMEFVDRLFLAKNSTMDVAAALPAGLLAISLFSFFTLTTQFNSAIVSQYFGRKQYESSVRASWAAFYFAIFAGIICSYLLPHIGSFFISISGHSPEMMDREMIYFNTIIPTGGFSCVMMAFCTFFSGRGKTLVVLLVTISMCLMNCFLDYVLIFGKLGMPHLGIAGAGLATTLSAVFGAGLAFTVFILHKQTKFPTRKAFGVNLSDLKRLVSFGAASGFQVCCDYGAFTFVFFLIGKLGEMQLAASTITASINQIVYMPLLGLSEATAIVVARHIGRNRKDISSKQTYRALKMAVFYVVVVSICILTFSGTIFEVFRPENGNAQDFQQVINFGRGTILCACAYNLFDGFYAIFMGSLKGAGDTKVPMIIMTIWAWVGLVMGSLFCFYVLKFNVIGMWGYIAFYIATLSGIVFFRYRTGKWKQINLIET